MNDFLDTINPIGKAITKKVGKKFDPCLRFKEDAENNKSVHPITKRYENKIKDALLGAEDVQKAVDFILRSLTIIINRYDLHDETNKDLIFEQIIIFINYFYIQLKSKYIFNTLTKNNLKEFNKQTIGDNINNLIQKGGNESKSGYCCIHFALFFKKVFDELEKRTNLGTSNYLFLEKDNGLDHSGLVVTFNGKNYLVDSNSFNGKLMQPIDNMGKYYDRMKTLKDFHKEDISYSSIQTVKNEYDEHDYNYYKVKIQSSDDLLSLLNDIPKVGSVARMYNIFGSILGVNLRISKEGIQLFGIFTYHFDHILNKEELDNISDGNLMDYLINSVSYKTNKDNDKRIKVFNFERKYIKDILLYFSDKIDYSLLRKILSNN